jgi:2-polyprenyl-6-methoxyphenol hydroxylase-like FAD-dependent oxidoreductase
LGYVIENRLLGEVLLAHLQQSPQVAWLAPAQVASVKPRQAGVEVQVVDAQAQHQRWQARLLVVADGAQSTTCRQLGITAQRLDYGQTGIVTTVTPRNGHHNIAWERFTPEGPLALLPQTQQRLGVTWCVNSARAERLMALDDRAFMAELREAAGGELGDLIKVGQRHTYPLALTLSDEQIRSRVVVLGNAAHGLHPVAGQGFNMAVRDIATLVRVVAGSAQSASDCVVTRNRVLAGDSPGQFPGDPGELRHLQEYFAQRERDQHNTILFSDQITRWFSTTKPAPRLMRNTGLLMFELVPGAKRLLARHAMGRASSTWLPDPVLLTQAGEPEPGSGQRRRAAKAKDSAQPVTQRGARTRRKVKQS